MSKIFEMIQGTKPSKSAFDLSNEKKLSCSMGELIPILLQEILPGDEFKMQTEVMIRFSPMLAPVMHRVNVYVHYFFVPNRIIWSSWDDFITGGRDGTSAPVVPTITHNAANISTGDLGDYLGAGFTSGAATYNPEISALPFRGYQDIYNEYYRDETLTDPVVLTTESEIVQLRMRSWEKDYFTSSLISTQKGPAASVPITFDAASPARVKYVDSETGLLTSEQMGGSNVPEGFIQGETPAGGAGSKPGTSLSIDNTEGIDITVNDLRTSSALQRWLEKQARGGYRLIETVLSHFGVKSSDARLNRPEYLGGGRQPVVMSEVLNTSNTATAAQGTMAGHGISVGMANKARKRFEEHGYLFGIMSVLPRTNYFQGTPRHFLRTDKLDYFWPEFAHLGEQEVSNRELYLDRNDTQANNEAVFGYQQYAADYKYSCSTIHGDFRGSLNFWHLGRNFTTRPVLNDVFVELNPDTRIFAVETGDTLWCQIFNNIKARRPMPYFSTPSLR